MLTWLILSMFTLGMTIIVLPIVLSIKFRKRLRLPSARIKRRQYIRDLYDTAVKRESEKKSNYKVARRLKTAGYPYGIQVFHYRLLQLCLPLTIGFLMLILHLIKFLMFGSSMFPILPFCAGVLIAYFIPNLILLYLARKRREILSEEIVKFSHRLVVCINEKIPLYYAVRRAGRTCKVLKPYVDNMLIDWMDNPRAAINHFGDQVGINEALPVTNTLLASWNASQEKIIELFHQQIRNIDTMRDFQIKKKIETSPLRVIFIIMIPFLVACILVMLPWYRSFIEILNQI